MPSIDPKKAQRVWERVRASLEPQDNCPTPTLPPIPVCYTPQEAWNPPRKPPKPRRSHTCPCPQHQRFLWILCLLLAIKCS